MPAQRKAATMDASSTANLGFEAKMLRLVAELAAQFAESDHFEAALRANFKGLGDAL